MTIQQERVSPQEYIHFLARTDLGSQYPQERFEERIGKLVQNAAISLTARTGEGELIGVCFGITDFAYWLFITDLGIDRRYHPSNFNSKQRAASHIKCTKPPYSYSIPLRSHTLLPASANQ